MHAEETLTAKEMLTAEFHAAQTHYRSALMQFSELHVHRVRKKRSHYSFLGITLTNLNTVSQFLAEINKIILILQCIKH